MLLSIGKYVHQHDNFFFSPRKQTSYRPYHERSHPYRPDSVSRPNPYTWVNPSMRSGTRHPYAQPEYRKSVSRHGSVGRASSGWGERSVTCGSGSQAQRSVERSLQSSVSVVPRRSRSPSRASTRSAVSSSSRGSQAPSVSRHRRHRERYRSPSSDSSVSCSSASSSSVASVRSSSSRSSYSSSSSSGSHRRSRSPSSKSQRCDKRARSASPEFIILDEYTSEEEVTPAAETPQLHGTW